MQKTRSSLNKLLAGAATLALCGLARADFDPIALTPGSFNADVVVEKTAPPPLNNFVTATMDGGTNNNSRTWFEQGFNTNMPTAGLLAAGTVFTASAAPDHEFQMPPSYAANNALFINSQVPSGSLRLTTPAVLTAISILGSSGGSAIGLNCTVQYQDGTSEQIAATVPDWFNGSAIAWTANGRYNLDNLQFDNLFNNNPRIYYTDIFVNGVSAVTNIVFDYVSGGGRSCILGLSGQATAGGNFTPLAVAGFTRDMVVEAAAPHVYGSLFSATTATMDGGTNNNSNTWYERGLNTGSPTTGLPPAGSAVISGNYTFNMPSTYVGNNALFIAGNFTTGTLTLNTPAALAGISFLSASGGGEITINYTVYHQGGGTESGSFISRDWFNTGDASQVFISNGRFNTDDATFNEVNANPQRPRLFHADIVLTDTVNPVTQIEFTHASGGGRSSIFAVSGQTSSGGAFSPVAVTGFTKDVVVEKITPNTPYVRPAGLTTLTTASMDGGTNNTGNTWYERGYYALFPNSGLPPAGSTINSSDLPDHHYQMPASYAANNAVYVDASNHTANLTLATPAWFSALSFLSATANNNVTNRCIMQYENGTSETNTFTSRDWFNNNPFAFAALGRVNLNNQSINNDPARTTTPNPRLYEAQFALNVPPGVKLTNVVLNFLGAINPTTGRMVVLAVSGTTGEVAPIIRDQPVSRLVMEGSNVVVLATSGGGTPPINYQWQVGTNNVWANVQNGGIISGAQSLSLTFSSIGWSNAADYRLIATGPSLSTTSAVATLTVLSGLPDVTQPTDLIEAYQPNGGGSNPGEEVIRVIDNTTSKYLHNGIPSGPIGLEVTPAVGGTILNVLRFYTANDATERDPGDYLLEGSNDGGANYATIATGDMTLPDGRNAAALAIDPLAQVIREIRFANTTGYTKYRLSFSKTKATSTLFQLGEVELLGVVNPGAVPTVLIAPTNTTVNEGTTAKFTVSAVGPGTIGYRWYNVTAGEPGTLIAGQNSATLSLPAVTAAMNGNYYRVVVTNQNGAVTSPALAFTAAQLTVASGPPTVVTDLPAEILVYAGRTAVLAVPLTGTEPFTSQWQANGNAMSDTARITGTHSNVLTIINAQTNDAANYQLFVNNAGGNAQSAVTALIVQTVPGFTEGGTGWGLNGLIGASVFPATMNGGFLELSTGANDTRRSAWYNYPQYIGAFRATFVYQDIGGGGADGAAFVLQNDPRGRTALGGGGGGLGYLGITPSAALQFNIFGTAGIAFNTNGATGNYSVTDPVNVAGGDPIAVTITYLGSVMQVVLSNTVTAGTFTTNFAVGSLPATVGADTAYIGFTAATGGTPSTQQISGFNFVPLPTATATASGGSMVISWPASIGGYVLQTRASLTAGLWSPVAAAVSLVGDRYQVTITPSPGERFYRLALQ